MITAREWIMARDPITDTITKLRREIADAADTGPLAELAGKAASYAANGMIWAWTIAMPSSAPS